MGIFVQNILKPKKINNLSIRPLKKVGRKEELLDENADEIRFYTRTELMHLVKQALCFCGNWENAWLII